MSLWSSTTALITMETDISRVSGNASDEIKRAIANPTRGLFCIDGDPAKGTGYSHSVVKQMVITEVSILRNPEDPQAKEVGRVVCELVVNDDMINRDRSIHGGCSAYLIDICSSMALHALALARGGIHEHVSQSINVVYHSPALIGDKLRVVNTTITMGARALSAKTEIWNATHHRLVVSGTHIKMQPSQPKPKL